MVPMRHDPRHPDVVHRPFEHGAALEERPDRRQHRLDLRLLQGSTSSANGTSQSQTKPAHSMEAPRRPQGKATRRSLRRMWSCPGFVDTADRTQVREECAMAKRKRRAFTTEFKTQTVRLVRDSGKPIGEVAQELDLTESAVRAWVRQATIDTGRGGAGLLTTEEREELGRLRREVRTLRMERDILKKATAFFAKESV